jgi:hypothetical protein
LPPATTATASSWRQPPHTSWRSFSPARPPLSTSGPSLPPAPWQTTHNTLVTREYRYSRNPP